MARLDSVIDNLFTTPGSELSLESGGGILLKSNGATTPLVKQPLTTPQIIGAVAEIVPADLRGSFPGAGLTRFSYQSPKGAVTVEVRHEPNKTRVSVTAAAPAAAQSPALNEIELDESSDHGPLELASAAELMELAQGYGNEPLPVTVRAPVAPPVQRAPAPAPVSSSGDPRGRVSALLNHMLKKGASDLHLSSDNPPMLRVDGDIVPAEGWPVMSHASLKELIWSIAPEKNRKQWDELRDTDFAHETAQARFRVNVFEDRKGICSVMRQIPNEIRTAESMGLSKQVLDLCFLTKGLVLVTGPTGSGKSTTLAAMIDFINRHREDHIITIEDPIEFVHPNKKCLVNQREVGTHTSSFKHALRGALREDPDVVLVGELRDLETIAIAIETAETGHLVFGTLHTNTAPSTVDRIIDQFPADRQAQIRTMLSESLKGVISQTLCKKIGGGRAPALEVLLVTGSVSNLIREAKTFQIPSIMQTGRSLGMQTMNDALLDLVKKKAVAPTDALAKAINRSEFKALLEKAGIQLPPGTV
jgi:twitching motility protein PilT